MTSAELYLRGKLQAYQATSGLFLLSGRAEAVLGLVIRRWAGRFLNAIVRSGSFAKGTGIRGDSDLDLLVSLRHDAPGDLAELYFGLCGALRRAKLAVREQNVALRTSVLGLAVDVIPARRQAGVTLDHSIYRSKARTWAKTNIHKHVQLIRASSRRDEIRLLKIWRNAHGLEFPSFYLELAVLEALRGRPSGFGRLEGNTLAMLEFLVSRLVACRVIDPVNSSNIVSDDLTTAEKQLIVEQASRSLSQGYWEDVLW